MTITRALLITSFVTAFMGFNEAIADNTADSSSYKVANIQSAEVLNVRQQPNARSAVIIQLPADARWILKRTSQRQGRWQKVVWGVKEGWVYDYYINTDERGSAVLNEHRKCVTQNPANAMCCGFNKNTKNGNTTINTPIIKTYMVVNVPKGQSLNVRSAGSSDASKIYNIPHNAVGIVKFPGKQNQRRNGVWQKIRWNGRDGWVNTSYLKYDPIISDYRNIVQNTCSI